MKFQKQLEATDCFRTAIAVLLEMDAEDVPHFYEDAPSDRDADKWDMLASAEQWIDSWLLERGCYRIKAPYTGEGNLQSMLEDAGRLSTLPYLLSGLSVNDIPHVVVCKGDQIIWDPSEANIGLAKPVANDPETTGWLVEWIVRAPS